VRIVRFGYQLSATVASSKADQPQTALEVSELSYTRPNILAGFGDRGAKYNAFLLHLILRSAQGRCRILDFTKLSERIFRL
jgi:hypothetical protein